MSIPLNHGIEEGPTVDSQIPEERKLARRLRIQKRLEVTNAPRKSVKMSDETIDHLEKSWKDYFDSQLLENEKNLKIGSAKALSTIITVRYNKECRENTRRKTEGLKRETILKDLEEEAKLLKKQFDEVAIKWSLLKKFNDPYHIQQDLINQKEKSDAIIKQKDEIIDKLKKEIILSERLFTKNFTKQNEDINSLSKLITKQIDAIKKDHRTKLKLFEELLSNIMHENNQLTTRTLIKRNVTANLMMENIFEQRLHDTEEFNKRSDEKQLIFEELFTQSKRELKFNILTAKSRLEQIKMIASSNSEKIDYNYSILKRRENENVILKSQCGRRINKLHDAINNLKTTLRDYRQNTFDEMDKKQTGIKKLQKSILDLDAKADNFAKLNDQNFHQIWNMNQKRCEKLLEQIIFTDKILHMQQLGIELTLPKKIIPDKTMMPSYKNALQMLKINKEVLDEENVTLKKNKRTGLSGTFPDVTTSSFVSKSINIGLYRQTMMHLLTLLSDKTGFLTESRLKVLINKYEDDQKTIVRLDNIFGSLNIQIPSAIDLLVKYFLPYSYCRVCDPHENGLRRDVSSLLTCDMKIPETESESSETRINVALEAATSATYGSYEHLETVIGFLVGSEISTLGTNLSTDLSSNFTSTVLNEAKFNHKSRSKYLCQYHHPLVISSIYVMKALKDFIFDFISKKELLPTTGERLLHKRITVSRLINDKDINYYWKCLKNIHGKDQMAIWKALENGLKYYQSVLLDRKRLAEEVCNLRLKNKKLKNALSKYELHYRIFPDVCQLKKQVSCSSISILPKLPNV